MSELGTNWQLFPLYGLIVTDDDEGLADPIFGTATIVSSSWAGKMAVDSTGSEVTSRLLAGSALVSELGADRLQHLPVDPKHVVECHPHSYIAVRNKNQHDAEQHAARIRSMLSAAVVLRGGVLQAFSSSPLSLAWSTVPVKVKEQQGRLQGQVRIVLNKHVFARPEYATKAEVRRSWSDGADIELSAGKRWDISSSHAFAKVLCGSSGAKTDLKRRLQAGGMQLNEASNVPFPMSQVQMAVAALEIILGANTFSRLEAMMKTFLPKSEDRVQLREILKLRNLFVHEGRVPRDRDQRKCVGKALLFGWVFLFVACEIAERAKTVGGFEDELEARVLSRVLLEKLEGLGSGGVEELRASLAKVPALSLTTQ